MKRGRLRIGGGALRGRGVAVPPGARPTGAKVRAALFSIWQERLPGARFLDLFAGSGAVGLEALSRGAALTVFVENDRRALAALARNCAELAPAGTIVRAGAPPGGLVELPGAPFDLVFADPPYRYAAYGELIAAVASLLAEGGELAVEHASSRALPAAAAGLATVAARRYGETALTFYRR